MIYDVHIINSFTGTNSEGNPAGVVITAEELPATIMQEIASRMSLSETAFIFPLPHKKNEYKIRWFTPVLEVPLCGHATLAAAAFLYKKQLFKSSVVFHSLSGLLRVMREGHRFILDFPLDIPVEYKLPDKLFMAMGIDSYVSCVIGKLTGYILIQLQSERKVAEICPNYPLLKAINPSEAKGITVTATADNPELDFVSRFFDPWAGIMEDPVTGSAHTLLGPYWSAILGKKKMVAKQISPRGGILYLEMRNRERIYIAGNAKIVGQETISVI
ncbi:MAG: PhzF family phenazine biosynthesis protein [Candidatus Cloacimonetes bacterium]|nr:PhzF family phenazine biosynthesis protein [Candidatus Cloacimonadota bacterium]